MNAELSALLHVLGFAATFYAVAYLVMRMLAAENRIDAKAASDDTELSRRYRRYFCGYCGSLSAKELHDIRRPHCDCCGTALPLDCYTLCDIDVETRRRPWTSSTD